MLTYTPNAFPPVPNPPEHSMNSNLNHRSLCPRDGTGFTQSMRVTPIAHGPASMLEEDAGKSSFSETVQVVPMSSGGYRVMGPAASISSLQRPPRDNSAAEYRRLSHNIASTDMQQRMRNRLNATQVLKNGVSLTEGHSSFTQSLTPAMGRLTPQPAGIAPVQEPGSTFHESLMVPTRERQEEFQCSCKQYHCHTFRGRPVNHDVVKETRKFVDTLTSATNAEASKEDHFDDLRNIFWTPSLSFHSYRHGDKKVEFSDLWPSLAELREHFENCGIQRTVLRDLGVLDLCKLAITCGPVRLLRCLIELELVRVDQQVDNGTGMLHLAVLSHNVEAVQYLTLAKISPKLRDKAGNTADQVCFTPSLKRHLPPRYQIHKDSSRQSRQSAENRMVLKASLQDKDTIFKLAANPKYFDEIQKKLQSLDFNVNTECDTNGDFLLHLVCRRGLSQLPLIMALVKIQGADVELCNADGVTPLMLAAETGNTVLCDVLMCLFGANPNKPNPTSGRCALHYAVEGNHRKTVECLIRRGADVNAEDHLGRRPDDVPLCLGTNDDCHEVILFNRTRRMADLCERIRKGELEKHHLLQTDLCVVNEDGYTLVMTAAIYNRVEALLVLLLMSTNTINAQHIKTGMTALSIAAQMGNAEAVEVLLNQGANPSVGDMKSYLPLHHAVLNNQEKVIDTMLEYFPQCYKGLYLASRLCKRTSIHVKLKSAFIRRQEEIVTPKLLACAMNGAADELFQLLDDGDNINPKSGTGNWPLYLAVENGHLDVVKLLFAHGGDIRKRHATTGETVLHISSKMGHTEITQYLLGFCRQSHPLSSSRRPSRKLLDINTTDTGNRTPLQVAAEKGFSRIVGLLLSHGATTALLDEEGQLITCGQYEGVRVQIESHREQHVRDVVSLINNRSKKALQQLQKIWLPRFDHNLRTKQGDTPLMVACSAGKAPVLLFLLESAVYTPTRVDDDTDDDSDADSGVLDPSGRNPRSRPGRRNRSEDGLQASEVFSQSTEVQAETLVSSGDFTHSSDCRLEDTQMAGRREGALPHSDSNNQHSLDALLYDISRPKGLSIYHDGLVSHVCAVSLMDGGTALHRALEYGDSFQLAKLLLAADKSCVNIQNNAGLAPLHLACKLGRKKVIELLLSTEGVDLNVRTMDSMLPEEMTTNKSIVRLISKARKEQAGAVAPLSLPSEADMKDETMSVTSPSRTGSTVNFDKVHSRYEALRGDKAN